MPTKIGRPKIFGVHKLVGSGSASQPEGDRRVSNLRRDHVWSVPADKVETTTLTIEALFHNNGGSLLANHLYNVEKIPLDAEVDFGFVTGKPKVWVVIMGDLEIRAYRGKIY